MNEETRNADPTQPLLSSVNDGGQRDPEAADTVQFDRIGLACLLVQHLSRYLSLLSDHPSPRFLTTCCSAWGVRTAEFALYLYLIVYFKDTLMPSSILGFSMTGDLLLAKSTCSTRSYHITATGIFFSRWAGSLVDKYSKLQLVRTAIVVQKISTLLAYVSFMLMLSKPLEGSSVLRPDLRLYATEQTSFATPSFIFLVTSGCVLHLSNTTISIAVERDWTTCIAQGPYFSTKLSKLNTYLRRINLLCKLCAPLFVSFLTVSFDHTDGGALRIPSVKILALVTAVSLLFELYWIVVVYKRFPMLEVEQTLRDRDGEVPTADVQPVEDLTPTLSSPRPLNYVERLLNLPDWKELVRLPIFFSSLSISLLYLTVLS